MPNKMNNNNEQCFPPRNCIIAYVIHRYHDFSTSCYFLDRDEYFQAPASVSVSGHNSPRVQRAVRRNTMPSGLGSDMAANALRPQLYRQGEIMSIHKRRCHTSITEET